MKVELAVLGSQSLLVLMVSVDITVEEEEETVMIAHRLRDIVGKLSQL